MIQDLVIAIVFITYAISVLMGIVVLFSTFRKRRA